MGHSHIFVPISSRRFRISPQSSAEQQGFTLIELLVAIAVIAIVIAILFPIFISARERGRKTVCQSNLRQIALAMQQYVQDNDSAYPLAVYQDKQLGHSPMVAPIYWQQLIFPYTKEHQVFFCPSTPSDAPFRVAGAEESLTTTDYAYDWVHLNTFSRKVKQGVAEAMLINPATITLNTDRGWVANDAYFYCRLVPKTSCGLSFTGSTLHSGGGNYSYIDGHVKWLVPEVAGETDCMNASSLIPKP